MRPFFVTVGILAWLMAFAVLWIFAENGGVQTVIAGGVFAIVAILALGCERILKLLEEVVAGLPEARRQARVRRTLAPQTTRVPINDPTATLL